MTCLNIEQGLISGECAQLVTRMLLNSLDPWGDCLFLPNWWMELWAERREAACSCGVFRWMLDCSTRVCIYGLILLQDSMSRASFVIKPTSWSPAVKLKTIPVNPYLCSNLLHGPQPWTHKLFQSTSTCAQTYFMVPCEPIDCSRIPLHVLKLASCCRAMNP